MSNNIEQLKKLAQIFNVDKIMSPQDIQEVFEGVMKIMVSFKKGNEELNAETKAIVKDLLDKVMTEYQSYSNTLKDSQSEFSQDINSKIEETKKLVKTLNSKLDKVSKKKDIVEVKETIIEREVIPDEVLNSKIEKQFSSVRQYIDDELRKSITLEDVFNNFDLSKIKKGDFEKQILDRAISILDQRTQFLINKINNLPTTSGGGSVSVNGAEVTNPDFIDSNTAEFDVSTSDVSVNVKGVNRVVVSGNTTATLGTYYISVATATYTDPTPAEGAGFTVLVRNGTSTIGGTAYSTAGIVVNRYYHSGAWANYVQMPQGAMSGDATQSIAGAVTIANNAVSNAKLAQMPTLTIKGNDTGGTANAKDLTVAEAQALLQIKKSYIEMEGFLTRSTLSNSTAYHWGNIQGTVTSTTINQDTVRRSGTIKSVYVYFFVAGTLATGPDSTLAVGINGSFTDISTTIQLNSAENRYLIEGLNIAVTKGDLVQLRITMKGSGTAPTNAQATSTIEIEI